MVLKSNTTEALHDRNTRSDFHDRVKKLFNTWMVQNMGTCTVVVMDCGTKFTRWEGIRTPKDPLPKKGEPTLTNINGAVFHLASLSCSSASGIRLSRRNR